MTLDVNVLVAASRSDHPHHKAARIWLEESLAHAATGRVVLLLPMVVTSFLRLVTHPKVFAPPTPINAAVGFIDAQLASASGCRRLVPSGLSYAPSV